MVFVLLVHYFCVELFDVVDADLVNIVVLYIVVIDQILEFWQCCRLNHFLENSRECSTIE